MRALSLNLRVIYQGVLIDVECSVSVTCPVTHDNVRILALAARLTIGSQTGQLDDPVAIHAILKVTVPPVDDLVILAFRHWKNR